MPHRLLVILKGSINFGIIIGMAVEHSKWFLILFGFKIMVWRVCFFLRLEYKIYIFFMDLGKSFNFGVCAQKYVLMKLSKNLEPKSNDFMNLKKLLKVIVFNFYGFLRVCDYVLKFYLYASNYGFYGFV